MWEPRRGPCGLPPVKGMLTEDLAVSAGHVLHDHWWAVSE